MLKWLELVRLMDNGVISKNENGENFTKHILSDQTKTIWNKDQTLYCWTLPTLQIEPITQTIPCREIVLYVKLIDSKDNSINKEVPVKPSKKDHQSRWILTIR